MGQWTVADRGRIYGEAYEARQRDPVVDISNRASVANGRMSRWERFNKGVELTYIDDMEGNPRAITPKQRSVLELALSCIDGEMLTMREMALRLGMAASTVSRTLAKLSAWGVLAYIVGRGRWAGLVIMRRVKGDRYDYLRQAAKARVRGWYQAAQRRLSRLAINVAPYINEEGVRVLSNPLSTNTSKGATLTAQRKWTPDELRSVGII